MDETTVCNAGFYPQFLWDIRDELSRQGGFDIQEVTRTLSCFHLREARPSRVRFDTLPTDVERIVEVHRGILVRGLPTLAPLSVERALLRPLIDLQVVQETNKAGAIGFQLVNNNSTQSDAWLSELARAHVAVDPRLSPDDMDTSVFDSDEERKFFAQILPEAIGLGTHQFCQPQTPFRALLPSETANDFFDNRVDFSLEIPGERTVFEVDGSQHRLHAEKMQDDRRDRVLIAAEYSVQRTQTDALDKPDTVQRLSQGRSHNVFAQCADQNVSAPLWHDSMGQTALHIALASFGVARIQFALLHALEISVLSLEQERWKLTILEQDVSCAEIAIADFVTHLQILIRLLDVDYVVPRIDLLIYTTNEMLNFPVEADSNQLSDGRIQIERRVLAASPEQNDAADLLIDVSVLQRDGYNRLSPTWVNRTATALEIRSAYGFQATRRVSPIAPIAYPINENSEACLKFFLQNIFRKKEFREKQVDILKRSIALQPVIGLLPTGAGKSLCYQLSALLQPGMTIVVDPIISLLIDQTENLSQTFAIDWLDSISSLQDPGQKKAIVQLMTGGALKFLFLTPERLQMSHFREELSHFCLRFSIPYAVIDEAHCVSEWGHDFRTSYLRLAKTIREYGKFGNFEPIIIALTGTASLVVLSDVQREIGIVDEKAQIYPESFDREELHFRVRQTASRNKLNELQHTLLWKHLPDELNTRWDKLYSSKGEATQAGIVFTPHAKGDFGAEKLSEHLSLELKTTVRYFAGGASRELKTEVQAAFKKNEFALLVATKAFGMGIDKSNIRYTIHYNIPPSLEAFYQEAGRAGRDRQPAFCWLIFSDDTKQEADRALVPDADEASLEAASNNYGGGDAQRLLYLHRNSFRGVEPEKSKIRMIYKKYLGRTLRGIPFGSTVEITVPFTEDGKDKNEQTHRDKALYRLAILGLVKDYTLEYHKKHFEVTAVRLTDAQIIENLQAYFRRYKTREFVDEIPQQVKSVEGNTTLGKCTSLLLDFVYDDIVKKRLTAMRSMVEVARSASQLQTVKEQDEYVRGELLAYLEESPFTKPLLALVEQIDPAEWLRILVLTDESRIPILNNVDGVRQLRGGCRRTLESYPEHPGLLFLSSIGRLLLPDPDVEMAMAEARRAFHAVVKLPDRHQTSIINELLQQGYKVMLRRTEDGPKLFDALATIALEEHPHRDLAHLLSADVPSMSEKIILNILLSEVRELNQRLLPEREQSYDKQPD